MSDEQTPATPLERAVHEFLRGEYPTFDLEPTRVSDTYYVIRSSALNSLQWAIDPNRPAPRPFISHDPAMKSGDATLNGTRLTVETVARCIWDGWDEDRMRSSGWTDLTRADMLVCCWYMGEHGSRTWRTRWQRWARTVHPLLHRSDPDYTAIDWPPTMADREGQRDD